MGQIGSKRAHLGFFSTFWIFWGNKIFCGKCDMPLSRGEQAQHVELLFVGFLVGQSLHMWQKSAKFSRRNLFHKIFSLIIGGHATTNIRLINLYLDKYLELEKGMTISLPV